MSNFLFLAKLISGRIMMAAVLLTVVYNPWFSAFQLVFQSWNASTGDYESGWLFKAIGVLILAGLVFLFVNTTRKSLGLPGLIFFAAILSLISAVPFYVGWMLPNAYDIFYMAYFFATPVLLGFGLSTGYVTRYLSGTLQTTTVDHTPQHPITEHHTI